MDFDVDLLLEYKELLQTTNLKECYQEFIKLFRYIRVALEKSMPEYKFQGNIVENGMDYLQIPVDRYANSNFIGMPILT